MLHNPLQHWLGTLLLKLVDHPVAGEKLIDHLRSGWTQPSCWKHSTVSLQRFWSKLVDHVAAGEKLIDQLKKWLDTTKLLETLYSVAKVDFNTGLAHCLLKLFGHAAAGEKLIDHLKKWLDTTRLLKTPTLLQRSTSTLAWHTVG